MKNSTEIVQLQSLRNEFNIVVSTMKEDSIPEELIFNWYQMALPLVPSGKWTMAQKVTKTIEIAGMDDKQQITEVFCSSMTGTFLPPQLLYEGKTIGCHPYYTFPLDFDVWHTPTHWSNEETMLCYIEHIIVPYVSSVKQSLGVSALAIFDPFRAQRSPSVLAKLQEHHV
ncbi:UNVERIFIED_CONTAM: hypothetical protein FKN15_010827 [Acipenser sinensis]